MKTSKMIYIGLLVGQALVLYMFESMIPVPFITPGAKLGLSNLITVIALYTLENNREYFIVVIIRIILSTVFGGNLSSFIYSISGGLLSLIVMIFIKTIGKDMVSIIGVSSAGAVFHNIGQLLIAAIVLNNIGVFLYLPIMSIGGIGTGIFIGITANYIVKHLKKLSYFNEI